MNFERKPNLSIYLKVLLENITTSFTLRWLWDLETKFESEILRKKHYQ